MDLNIDNPEQIKKLIEALQQLLPKEDVQEAPKKQKTKSTKKSQSKSRKVDEFDNPNIKTKSTRLPKREQNKFLSMPERNMHKSDVLIDKKLCVQPPSPRTRTFEPVNVRCRSCGKSESVNPSILDSTDRYKCNKCSTMAGG